MAAHRPVIVILAGMVEEAMQSGQIEVGDSEMAATNLYDVYEAHQRNLYLGNSLGGPRPAPRELIRFCLLGLGPTSRLAGRRSWDNTIAARPPPQAEP